MMTINIEKNEDDISLKMIINGKEEPFDYITLINRLHGKEKIENINFSDEIDEWEKEEIQKLINKINDVIEQPTEE